MFILLLTTSTRLQPSTCDLIDVPRASFVSWKEQKVNVIGPKQENEIKILYTDPCLVLKEQFPSFYSPSTDEYNPVYYAYYGCSDHYKRNVIQPLNDLSIDTTSSPDGRVVFRCWD